MPRRDPIKPFLDATLVSASVTISKSHGATSTRAIRPRVTLQFGNHEQQTFPLSTLKGLLEDARRVSFKWGTEAVQRITNIIDEAERQITNDPAMVQETAAIHRDRALNSIRQLREHLRTQIFSAVKVLRPGDLDGQVIDLGDLYNLAVADSVMES